LVENSDIEDKDLILNVLQMYSSPIERDQEIQNMSAVFKVLAEEILPQLRRTRFTVDATYAGLTDEEILEAAKKGCDCLDAEHLLHAATLTDVVAEKIAIYELAANKYGDARAYNNLGVYKAVIGDLKGAKAAFEKAEAEPAVAGNLAAVSLAMGDLEAAKSYLKGADAEAVKATEGALALAEGNYQEAKAKLNGYNLAVAELCDNNVEGAKAAIAEVKGAEADYVRAIIANREGDADKALAYLKSAVAAKPELKAQAQNDIEFYELLQTSEL
jgi:Flp pilus assembly protein TadD